VQELGEILAIGHTRHINNVWLKKNREVICFNFINNKQYVYLVGIHHDRLYVTTAEFPEQYFNWVNEELLPPGQC
jgi:hypothetical protein